MEKIKLGGFGRFTLITGASMAMVVGNSGCMTSGNYRAPDIEYSSVDEYLDKRQSCDVAEVRSGAFPKYFVTLEDGRIGVSGNLERLQAKRDRECNPSE